VQEYLDLLKGNHDYRQLWLAKLISLLGDWFNLLASATLIATLTGSGTAISALFLARFLPLFFTSPFAGVIADRLSRRQIMIASDLLRALTVLGFLFVRDPAHIWIFYTLTALQFTLSAFFIPAERALLPSLVRTEELVTANALDSFTWSSMLAIGALLGGIATAAFGIRTAFVLDALTFMVSAWFVSRVTVPPLSPTERAHRESRSGGFFEFVDGLRYLRGRRFILGLALAKAAGSLIWGAANVVEISMAEKIFPINGNGALTLGLIYATVGLGTGFGPLFVRRWLGDNRTATLWAITLGFALLTGGMLGLGWAPTLGWALAFTLMRSLGTGALWVFSSAFLQRVVADSFRGRVFAFEFAALTLTQSLSTIWAGVAQDKLGLGVQQVFAVTGLASIVVLIGWLIFRAKAQSAPAIAGVE